MSALHARADEGLPEQPEVLLVDDDEVNLLRPRTASWP
jgi:hypothetical protein